jgi:hypothetical protein
VNFAYASAGQQIRAFNSRLIEVEAYSRHARSARYLIRSDFSCRRNYFATEKPERHADSKKANRVKVRTNYR